MVGRGESAVNSDGWASGSVAVKPMCYSGAEQGCVWMSCLPALRYVMLNEEPEAAGDWQERKEGTDAPTFKAGVRRLQGALAERYRAWSQEMARVQSQ